MQLYEYSISRSIRCRWMFAELGVTYDSIPVNLRAGEHKKPEFLKLNPYGKIPFLVDGDLSLMESAAICTYLGDKYPESALVPKAGTKERARYDQWLFFCIAELDAPLWLLTKNTFVYPENKRSPVAMEMACADFKKAMMVMEAHLATHEYILAGSFTAADIVVGHTLLWASGYEITKPHELLKGCSAATAYLLRLAERTAMPKELKTLI